MAENIYYRVYVNVHLYLKNRGMSVITEPKNKDEFLRSFEHYDEFKIVASSGDKIIYVIIINSNGKYFSHGPDLRTLMSSIEFDKDAKGKKIAETILVTEREFFKKKNLLDVYKEFYSKQKGSSEMYRLYSFDAFAAENPECVEVPKHRIMTSTEVSVLLEDLRCQITDLPQIYETDPPIVWLGAKHGQVVEILRLSESGGLIPYYRVVKKSF
jgi:DNA-directed RNA polymerase subunit H (RpoH/RPB5)